MENTDLEFKPNDSAQGNALVAAESARAMQEVHVAMVIAKQFQRNEVDAFNSIVKACKRKSLAENSMYAYPRGTSVVTGPSIRLAEAIAQRWGNLEFGIRELSQKDGFSEVEAYAWDIQTNTRQKKVFRVPHIRYSKKHGNTKLTDPRDIYEMIANQGARRLRACILGVIPGDIVESAVKTCEQTIEGASDEPLKDRVRNMVVKFEEIGVTREMIEIRLNHKIDVTTATEIVNLVKIYKSIQDGMAKREDFFEVQGANTTEETEALEKKIKAKSSKKTTEQPEPPQDEKKEPDPAPEPEEKENASQGISEPQIKPLTADQITQLKEICRKSKLEWPTMLDEFCHLKEYSGTVDIPEDEATTFADFIKSKKVDTISGGQNN